MESLPGDIEPTKLRPDIGTHTRFGGLWHHRDFMRLWTGQTISKLGSQIGGGAFGLIAILMLSATPVQMGLLAAAQSLPMLLLGLPAGVWVDRMHRRPIMIAADVGRLLLLATIPLAAVLGWLAIELLCIVAALVSILTLFFDLAYSAFLPTLVPREQLVEGNSKLGVSDSLAEIAGPAAGGALVQFVGAPLAIALDALSFLISGLALWRIRTPEPRMPAPAQRPSLWSDIGEGLRATLGTALLRALLGCTIFFNMAGGIIGSLYALYAIRELGLTPVMLGAVIGVGGVSALLGALISERIVQRLGIGPTISAAVVMIGIMGLLLPLAQGVFAVPMLILGQAGDAAWSIYLINELTVRQSATPNRLLGRVNASLQFLAAGAVPLGAIAGGLLAEAFGLRAAMAVGVGMILCGCVWILCSPLPHLRKLPEAAAELDSR
ncbi:MAG: MFS transporter [Roseiflexaceae bacterium]